MRGRTGTVLGALLAALATGGAPRAEPAPDPCRILIMGDSMMRVPAHSIERECARREGVQTHAFTSLGSGLARLDVVDWLQRIREHTAAFKPDTVVMFIGTNDRQPLRTNHGVIRPEQEEWEQEYARRVGEAMDLLAADPVVRVYWLELPDMKLAGLQEEANLINAIFEREAARRERVVFYRTRPLLSRTPGVFSPYLIGERGLPLSVRDSDGVHLNRAGADLLARNLHETFWPESVVPDS